MRKQSVIALALLVAAVSVVGAVSYTQASVDRTSNINVKADNAALIGLEKGAGIEYDSVTTTTDGELQLNLDDSGTGVNGNANFHYGADISSTTPTQTNTAFNISNNDNNARDFTVSYSVTGTDGDTNSNNVKFHIYTYDGTSLVKQTTVSEGGSYTQTGLGAGKKLYVFVEVDTAAGDLGSSSDLSGTLTVSAT